MNILKNKSCKKYERVIQNKFCILVEVLEFFLSLFQKKN
ncbi:hypothetical protein LEP1GSC008_0970 [Leptospira kirschneri serovar Bulgarica str. Nikolaevo]|uniref:Uncharacterized protein n=1 Tax=Leptospira kirschneri serovar Bulgarica str. Nikolaevo TaxID=1240687 RepID=M6FGL6_9LEPT|nr:hypothetical protein LEP1GSC008_0970 [Leptospira kirschneri serovar Bulgarica str. Nikolaevo]